MPKSYSENCTVCDNNMVPHFLCGTFFIIGNSSEFPIIKKRSAKDAHLRDRNHVAKATALGARISLARFFLTIDFSCNYTEKKGKNRKNDIPLCHNI